MSIDYRDEPWIRQLQAEVAQLREELAELEREMHKAHAQTEQVLRQRDSFAAALSSARELLEQVPAPLASVSVEWIRRRDAWLRAHPEPTTTTAEQRELRLQAQGFEPVTEEQQAKNLLVNLGQATPAATVAEQEYRDSQDRCESDGSLMHDGKCVQCGKERET